MTTHWLAGINLSGIPDGLLNPLIEYRDINQIGVDGNTALIDCLMFLSRRDVTNDCRLPIITQLINAGADVNGLDRKSCWSPMILAAILNFCEIVELLFNKKADPNKKDINGWTAMVYAASHTNSEIVKFLMEHGATVDVPALHKVLQGIGYGSYTVESIRIATFIQSYEDDRIVKDFALVFKDHKLSPFVIVMIIDFLPMADWIPNLRRIRLIEKMQESIRKVLAKRTISL